MLGGGQFATAHTNRMGSHAEDLFEKICKANGMTVKHASKIDDMTRHFDFFVRPWNALDIGRTSARVEVKAMKCPRRGLPPDETLIYVELVNVIGKLGWVFGDADILAFEQPCDRFLLVKREELARKALEMWKTGEKGEHSGIKGTLWTRPGREDLVLSLDRDMHVKCLTHSILGFPSKDISNK